MGDDVSTGVHAYTRSTYGVQGMSQEDLKRLGTVASFMQQDEDNVAFRRFDRLRLLHLLSLQHQLSFCAADLKKVTPGSIATFKHALEEIGPLIKEYDEAMCIYERMQKRLKMPHYVEVSLRNRAKKKTLPAAFVEELGNDDEAWRELMCIASSADKGAIHRFVDKHERLKILFPRVQNPVKEKEPDPEENSNHLKAHVSSKPDITPDYYYSEMAVRIFENSLLSALMCALIMVPVSTLSYVPGRPFRILLILGCVVSAFLVTNMLSRKVQQGNLATLITYTTLLTVFLDQQQK